MLRPVWSAVTRASAAIDRGVVRMLERRMAATAPTAPDLRDARPRLVELAAIYGDGTLGLPSRFFPEPEPAVVSTTEVGSGGGARGGRVQDLSYASTYRAITVCGGPFQAASVWRRTPISRSHNPGRASTPGLGWPPFARRY